MSESYGRDRVGSVSAWTSVAAVVGPGVWAGTGRCGDRGATRCPHGQATQQHKQFTRSQCDFRPYWPVVTKAEADSGVWCKGRHHQG